MSERDEPKADRLPDVMNGVREAIYNLRSQRLGVRIGGDDATLQGQWVLLSLSLLLVFACFFAIGRFRAGGGAASPAAAPSALVGPAGQSGVPTGLSGGSPIAGAVPVAIAVKPRPRPAVQPLSSANLGTVTTGQSRTGETSRSESPAPESQSSSEPAPEPAPTKASAPSRRAGGSGSSGQSSAKGGSRSAGGTSFDTSE